jgi:spore cortex formation protein SpoVR/YcgB (stage V sporulation)
MNEGWATFWHYTLLNTLYDQGRLTDGFMMEFLLAQQCVPAAHHQAYYNGINPYALGFSMMSDIRRICENPTDEDREWFPDIAGSNWLDTLQYVMRNYKDELHRAVPLAQAHARHAHVRRARRRSEIEVSAIHNERGFQYVRQALSRQYDINHRDPTSRSGRSTRAATAA